VADGVYSDNVDARLTGIISGAGPLASLVKTGAGTLALDADNTYEGRTTILDGTLLVNGSLSGISGVTVHAGATLGGSGTIAGTNTILHGGFLAPGESVGTLTFLDDLDISGVGPGALRFELGGLDHYDQIVVGGTLTIDELAWDHFAFTPLDGFGVGVYTLFDGTIEGGLGANIYGTIGGFQAYLELGSLQLVVIPEPGAWLLLAMGGLVLLMVRRRRR
jgi:autotransporter-associated beta strand protein